MCERSSASICGSDLHVVYDGFSQHEFPAPPGYPGHEGVGVVEATGARVLTAPVPEHAACFGELQAVAETSLVPLPDGAAWYAYNARRSTTTELDPEHIHQLGLSEVKRIRGEMDAVMRDRLLAAKAGLSGEALGRLWQAFQDGAPGMYWSRVWALYVLGWWCRTYGVSVR